MKLKNLLIILLVIAIIISFFTLVFKKEYKVVVIKDIDELAFNDSIISVHYYKDDYGPGIETQLKNYSTSFCFSGINEKLNLLYFDYARKGDVILKEKNAKIFYIKRNDSMIGFALSKCN